MDALAGRVRGLARWEMLLALIIVGLLIVGTTASPVFLTARNVPNLIVAVIEVSIMALAMTMIIIAGEIDLSVESMAGLACAVIGVLSLQGVPLEVAIPIALFVGVLGGLLNGIFVTVFGLPSLVVTLGTLALYRGLALAILGSQGVSGFAAWFTTFGFRTVPGTPIPWPAVIFLALAIILGLVLHATWAGRQIYATGKNAAAARFSGVPVARLKLALFVLSGTVAALAGVILTARFASARADIGQGLTLTVVTIVLLGGVNIFGGRGTILGVVLAAIVLALLGNILRLTNVSAEIQSIAIGLLLIVSVVLPNIAHQLRSGLSGPGGGRMSVASAGAGEAEA